jgi:hypothetical protein
MHLVGAEVKDDAGADSLDMNQIWSKAALHVGQLLAYLLEEVHVGSRERRPKIKAIDRNTLVLSLIREIDSGMRGNDNELMPPRSEGRK